MKRVQFIFSGSGGQGVITSAIILGEAAALEQGLHCVQTQSYGPEARGGATRSDVIIDDSPIYFPKVQRADVLICLTQQAFAKYAGYVLPYGLVITDVDLVNAPGIGNDADIYRLPLYRSVTEQLGSPLGLNIALLGAVVKSTKVVEKASVLKIIKTRFPKFAEDNEKAFEIGYSLVD